jgi:hypothetical protein
MSNGKKKAFHAQERSSYITGKINIPTYHAQG